MFSVFIDTNCFLHLRDLKDISWVELFPGEDQFEIVIAPIVIEELDRFKTDRDDRKRDRSRAALNLIEAASQAPEFRSTIRSAPFEVSIRIATGDRPDWDKLPKLDPSKPDDQLVATALSEATAGQRVLVSFDRGPIIRARLVGLAAVKPKEDWELADQRSEAALEITRLKRDLEAARATRPQIVTGFLQNGKQTNRLDLAIPLLNPLPKSTSEKLVAKQLSRNPKEILAPIFEDRWAIVGILDGYTMRDLEEYEKSYEDFAAATQSYFETLHTRIAEFRQIPRVEYFVKNVGVVTALNLHVDFTVEEKFTVLADSEAADRFGASLRPPVAPDRPKTIRQRQAGFDLSVRSLMGQQHHSEDATSFYWRERPTPNSPVASSRCAEFRPRRYWNDELWLHALGDVPLESNIELYIDATNAAEPVRASARIVLQTRTASWTDIDVLSDLEDWIAEIVSEK